MYLMWEGTECYFGIRKVDNSCVHRTVLSKFWTSPNRSKKMYEFINKEK